MREYLTARLFGPMASWGEVAAGELRPTQDHPTRSAVLGFLGACLGIDRADHQAHRDLSDGLYLGVFVEHAGTMIEDYHTTQTPDGTRGRELTTRADELRYKKVNTILSRREYRCDQVHTIALWCREEATERYPPLPNCARHQLTALGHLSGQKIVPSGRVS